MRFKQAVESTPGLEQAHRPGLQAIQRRDHRRISCRDPHRVTGSVDLDRTLARLFPDDPRCDYGVGKTTRAESEVVAWIEVHPASSDHVDEVLRKFDWLKKWLRSHATELDGMPKEFIWVASGRVSLRAGSRQLLTVASKGIRFAGSHHQLS